MVSIKSLLFLASAVSAEFYLQITNGTHKGQYLSAPTYVPLHPKSGPNCAFKYLTWVNNLQNATVWTLSEYSTGGFGLALDDGQLVTIAYNGSDPSPTPILIGNTQQPTTCGTSEWGVEVVLPGYNTSAPSGPAYERDDTLTQYRAWAIIDGHVGIAGLGQKGADYISMQYLRYSN